MDDDELIRETLAALVHAHDHLYVTCSSGNEAIAVVRNTKDFRLIICDIEMSDGNGFDVCSFLDLAHLPIPVVLCSGSYPLSIPSICGMPVPFIHKGDPKLLEIYIRSAR